MYWYKTDTQINGTNKEPDKPTPFWPINLCERRQEYTMEKTVSSIRGTVKTGQLFVKE